MISSCFPLEAIFQNLQKFQFFAFWLNFRGITLKKSDCEILTFLANFAQFCKKVKFDSKWKILVFYSGYIISIFWEKVVVIKVNSRFFDIHWLKKNSLTITNFISQVIEIFYSLSRSYCEHLIDNQFQILIKHHGQFEVWESYLK